MKKTLLSIALTAMASSATVSAAPILDFIIDGDTFNRPFSITNSSTAGETVTRFQLDLRPTNKICFDPAGDSLCNSTNGVSFSAVSGSGSSTGLVSGTVTNEAGGVNAWDYLDIVFNDFDSGETFSWDIDVDNLQGLGSATVRGNEMIGALAYVDFSSGVRLIGELSSVAGNGDASAFTVIGQTPINVSEPATLALLGLGLAGLGFSRRKTNKA